MEEPPIMSYSRFGCLNHGPPLAALVKDNITTLILTLVSLYSLFYFASSSAIKSGFFLENSSMRLRADVLVFTRNGGQDFGRPTQSI
ncbi:hypothetical protein Tco_0810210 [Tanacetum coccineum]